MNRGYVTWLVVGCLALVLVANLTIGCAPTQARQWADSVQTLDAEVESLIRLRESGLLSKAEYSATAPIVFRADNELLNMRQAERNRDAEAFARASEAFKRAVAELEAIERATLERPHNGSLGGAGSG